VVRVELTVSNTAHTRRLFFLVSDRVPTTLSPEGTVDLPVAVLGPGERTRLSYEVRPPRRGAYALGPARLLAPDAIGLRQFGRDFAQVDELLAYPQALVLPHLWSSAIGGRHPVRPRRRLRGEGGVLYGIRDYVPGDDPRRLDWKTTARRGKLAIVEYERPESLEAVVILDLDRHWHCGAGDRHTLEYAVTLAATLFEQAYERGSTTGLIAAGKTDFSCPSLAEDDQRLRLYEALARVQPDADLPLARVVADHAALLPRRCSVAVLSPSPQAGPVATHLRALGHSLSWFVLDAPSFDPRIEADYGTVKQSLAGTRGRLHLVRGDLPLAAHWGGGASPAPVPENEPHPGGLHARP
ncbi:MAG: DUF58 domain-containing protein, partial [Armatimonadota bacterium]